LDGLYTSQARAVEMRNWKNFWMKGLDSWESTIQGISKQLVEEPVGYLYLGENVRL
jgi:hypothetical protein